MEKLTTPAPQAAQNTRRSFLKNTTVLAAGVAIGVPWFGGCRKRQEDADLIWDELARSLKGKLLRPNYEGFKQKAAPWALEYSNILPLAIASCISKEDVRTCILWAQKHNVPFVARSGGHSYAGYSTINGLIVDVSPMTEVTYDWVNNLLVAKAGVKNIHVYDTGAKYQLAIPHGRCFEVGVAGLTLGGGLGFDARMRGYTCDHLVETEIVLANGDIIICNEKQNADLFWACRGAGGGNFGIHTSFSFSPFPVNHECTSFQITWDTKLEELLAASQLLIEDVPNDFGMKLGITRFIENGVFKTQLYILGAYYGNRTGAEAILSTMLQVATPISKTITTTSYWQAQRILSDPGTPEYSHERSKFAKNLLTQDAISTIFTHLNNWPGSSVAATWKFFLLGGAVDEKAPTDMAMVHRGYPFLSSIEIEWSTADSAAVVQANKQWMNTFHNAMTPYTSEHSYQNFIDPDQTDYLYAYYGENLPRLQEVKRKYDPKNVFRYPQSIPL